jgi:hypothetical protein
MNMLMMLKKLSPSPLWSIILSCFILLGLQGCASQNIDLYTNEKPSLDLREYLNGNLVAHGIFQDRSGQVVKRFSVQMKGTWSGPKDQETGVLEEDFIYSDGSKQRRVWTLKRQTNGSYIGTADDVKGQATGLVKGNALNWKYTLLLPVDGTVYEVQFDDWMYLMNDQIMLNKAAMSKFGIHLGDVTLTFVKEARTPS